MLKLVERDFFRPTPIRLAGPVGVGSGPGAHGAPTQSVSPEVQVLRVGKFNHPKYGEFEITTATLEELKQNFDKKIRGVDIAVDYFHKSDEEAAGWIRELYLSEDQTELWAKVDWTLEATKKLAEREIRYFSPDFAFQWTDPETNKTYSNVLFGGGLTNRPFVKDMAAIVASEQGEQMKIDELEKLVLKLSEDGKAKEEEMAAMKKKLEEMSDKTKEEAPEGESGEPDEDDVPALKAKLAEMTKKCAEYEEKMKKHSEDKQLAEKEAAFTVLLSEGKACAAQKDAFIKGDTAEFAKLSQPLNLSGKGNASNPTEESAREDRVMKLAEEKRKADPKLDLIEAITLANKEIK